MEEEGITPTYQQGVCIIKITLLMDASWKNMKNYFNTWCKTVLNRYMGMYWSLTELESYQGLHSSSSWALQRRPKDSSAGARIPLEKPRNKPERGWREETSLPCWRVDKAWVHSITRHTYTAVGDKQSKKSKLKNDWRKTGKAWRKLELGRGESKKLSVR